MQALTQDLKQALRVFRDSPVFAATAVIALTLGIGVNTAIFSIVNAVLLKPLPFPEPDRLVSVVHTDRGAPTAIYAAPAHFLHWRSQTDVLEDVAAWRTVSFDYAVGDVPIGINAGTVSEAYFRALRAPFAAGRAFTADDDLPGAAKTVVISHGFWTRRLAGDSQILGKTISLNGTLHTVIGITGRELDVREIDLRGTGLPEVWVPLQVDPRTSTTDFAVTLDVFARLKPGVTLEGAQQRLAASISEYRERFPGEWDNDDWGFSAVRMKDSLVGHARPTLLMLMGAVSLVLLVACANVANLLLVRAAGRDREIAIRATLGAGRARIVRQLLTESVVLTLTGGALGLIAGFIGIRGLLAIGVIDLPRLAGASVVGLDWRVLIFTLMLCVATGILFGLVPALVSARTDLRAVMNDSSGRATGGNRQTKTQSALVTIEVGLAVVLVIGAGLLIRTGFALSAVDLGISTQNVLTMRTSFSDPRFESTAAVAAISERVLERLRSIAGVEVAAASVGLPLQVHLFPPFDIVGRETGGAPTGAAVAVPIVGDYFEALQIPLLAGRRFAASDHAGAAGVVLINQAMADLYWAAGGDPLRDHIRIGGAVTPEAGDEPPRQIIGIVGNVRQLGIMDESGPTMYFPHAQLSDRLREVISLPMAWIVRTRIDPAAVSAVVQKTLREETGQPVTHIQSLQDAWLLSIARQRLNLWLMAIFGGTALLLGAVGIYGLVAYSVQHRRHEIGIRMAVGARPTAVLSMVIWQGLLRVLVGVGAGLVGGYFLANLLASVLFGVEPHDVAVFVTVPVILTAVGLAAVCVPAVRATRVDPTVVLRSS